MTRPISLYLHVPFCTVKCAYCDFNSYAEIEERIPAWEEALLAELRLWAPRAAGRTVPTVFFGGGTPSLLDGWAIQRILDTIRAEYVLEAGAEITLEANPESVDAARIAAYRKAGVNRISMGVQSLDPQELRFLDRLHSAERAREAFGIVRAAGFENVSTDLIYGLPDQSLGSWQRTLEGVVDWGPDHLSCYALTVEEGTPLAARVARGQVPEADPDLVADMAAWTEERLAKAGYAQYEISNFARPGRACRHNLVYWRHEEYVGLGPGAHGFVDGVRYGVDRNPGRYIAALRGAAEREGPVATPAVADLERPDARTTGVDALTLGLRLNDGIALAPFAKRYPSALADAELALAWAERAGLLERDAATMRLTSRGRRLSNELFVRLLAPELV